MTLLEAGSARFGFTVLRPAAGASENITRQIIAEAPIAIEYNGIGYAVMMATPIDLTDFVLGFSLSEGLIESVADIAAVDCHKAEKGWIVRVQLPHSKMVKIEARARQRVSESSCGLCGMDNLDEVMRVLPQITATHEVPDAAIFFALDSLRTEQKLNAATGAAHAAAFCDTDGAILCVREDVGRHNALDKVIGALAQSGITPSTGFLLLTARCSFELVQKTIIANCPLLVTISAATDLAIQTAHKHGLRLVSLARPDSALFASRQSDR